MTAGVFADPLRRVDHEQGGVRAGGPGDHIFEEFDVPGRVDDDVFPFFRLEEAARRVDGDPLRALVLQGVEEEGVFKRLSRAAAEFADAFDLAVGEGVRVGEEAPDDGALAVVHMARDDDVHVQFIVCHHIYPPRLSSSSPPPSSLSCSRPLLSATRANFPERSSSMISSSVEASESTGLVQGQQPSER